MLTKDAIDLQQISFFGPASEERQIKSVLMSKDEILPPKTNPSNAWKRLRFDQQLQQQLPERMEGIDHHTSTPKDQFDDPHFPPQGPHPHVVPTLASASASAAAENFALVVTNALIPPIDHGTDEDDKDLVPENLHEQFKAAECFRDEAQREKEKLQKRLNDLMT